MPHAPRNRTRLLRQRLARGLNQAPRRAPRRTARDTSRDRKKVLLRKRKKSGGR